MTYLLELNEQVEDLKNFTDEEDDNAVSSELYTISSYGIDYPVETLVSRIDKEQFYFPDFQRDFIWSKNIASRFIESLLLGLPVPGIFLYKESSTGKHLVIDGQQRLISLHSFFHGKFKERKFSLSGINSIWEGKTYADLGDDDQIRLADTSIRATIFTQDSPKDEMNSVYEVFERINTGGVKLSAQEIRSCIFHGNFNDFLHSLNTEKIWRTICGAQRSNRLKDVEIILRFFAFLERRDKYSPPMKQFLNNYMAEKRNFTDEQLEGLSRIFIETMDYIYATLGDRAFRPEKALNVAVFDAVATSIALKIQDGETPCKNETRKSYFELLKDEEFKEGYLTSTASPENVNKRFGKAGKAFGVA